MARTAAAADRSDGTPRTGVGHPTTKLIVRIIIARTVADAVTGADGLRAAECDLARGAAVRWAARSDGRASSATVCTATAVCLERQLAHEVAAKMRGAHLWRDRETAKGRDGSVAGDRLEKALDNRRTLPSHSLSCALRHESPRRTKNASHNAHPEPAQRPARPQSDGRVACIRLVAQCSRPHGRVSSVCT